MGKLSTVADIIRAHGAGRADHPALVLGDREVTWGELARRSRQVADLLAASGVGALDRVAFLDKNGIEHFEVFFGAALLNAVCVDVNWRLAGPEIEYIVNDSGAKVLIVGPDFVPVLETFADSLSTVSTILVIAGPGGPTSRFEDYASAVDGRNDTDPGAVQTGQDVAFQLYSSGTTGRPKGVLLSNDNFFALLPTARDMWRIDADTVNLVAMPLFHIGGGGWAIAGMCSGATSIIVRDLDPAALVQLLTEKSITNAFLVPAVLQFMLQVPGVEDGDYSALRAIVYGASPISESVLAKSVNIFKCDFWQAYGLTETTGAIVNLASEDHDTEGSRRHLLRSCGKPGPGVGLRIVDTDTQLECEVGQVGEIWVNGPQIMLGYWNMPEETAGSITDGWFHTGDAGYLDAEGYLYIHDRVKDMIVSGGENVYPAEVENVLMGHPGIGDVAVIGVPDEKWGESPKALVVRAANDAGAALTEREVIDHARERLAKFKCPTTVEWLEVLPRNPSGKVLKKDLREPYWAGRDRRVS
ncbi:MAG: putative fatty-acid--CoA ligase [Ilumatobacteraceae bacterium]|nr:putative fatty-acid--CoA ligase [Ilumatobacteraceae bacterium]